MSWLFELPETQPIAYAIGALALVCVLGMTLGSVKIRGIGLGTSGVLFAGILIGHFADPVDHHILEFVKEFGLVLFVFTIGLQLGPGFFSTFREQGVRLNLLAGTIVISGGLLVLLTGWLAGFDPAALLGIFSGASTNTPSLGAGTQALSALSSVTAEQLALPALAYAVTYPPAIVGIIISLLFLKMLFRIEPEKEAAEFVTKQKSDIEPLERWTLEITNPELEGRSLSAIPELRAAEITVSRICHQNQIQAATGTTPLHCGDRISLVGTRAHLAHVEKRFGQRIEVDLLIHDSELTSQKLVVTARKVLGQTVGELGLGTRFGVVCTRISRSGVELSAVPHLRLQYGDQLQIVGAVEALKKAAAVLGNSIKELNETQFIPLFIGITLGVLIGSLPLAFPGLPHPVKLGLAGGPLIVALLLGRLGHFRRQVWYMPLNTNLAFREFGIALFFAAVGLTAGAKFFSIVFSLTGMEWMLAGICVTMIPLLLVGLFSRAILKMNFVDLSGLIAGSMTDPPALAFASNISGSDAPAVAYATVYPFTTLLRILLAQFLATFLFL